MRLQLALALILAGCTAHNPGDKQDMSASRADMSPLARDLGSGDMTGMSCGDAGTLCTTATGGLGLCNAGSGICACGGSSADDDCNNAYGGNGTTYVCNNGNCVLGDCSTSADCTMGQECVSNNCVACSGMGASDTCASDPVYGNAWECVNGGCVMGNCRDDGDCTQGGTSTNTQLCLDNVCTPCTSDQQCQTDGDTSGTGGATSLCNTANDGVCEKNVTCSPTGSGITAEEAACANYNNGDDICCNGTCLSGSSDPMHDINCCAGGTDCSGVTGRTTCAANGAAAGVCSACMAVMANGANQITYYVDPVNGDDEFGTGNNAPANCAFATVRRALQVVGGAPTDTVSIVMVSGTTTLANSANPPKVLGEVYPITVPPNVTITTQDHHGAGDVTVTIPAMQTSGMVTRATTAGFVFTGKSSGLANFTVEGGNVVPTGVQVQGYAPTASAPVSLSDVVVSGFATQGVLVSAPATVPANPQLLISGGNGGTHIDGNGNDTVLANGMTDQGSVTVTATDKGKPVTFSGNGQDGIAVTRAGQLTLTGSGGGAAPTQATAVVLANNRSAGLVVSQTPAAATAARPPSNSVTGATIFANGTGPTGVTFTSTSANGIRVTGGSSLSVRSSLVYGQSKGSGVRVESFVSSTAIVNDVSGIDLGSGATGDAAGNNTLQTTGTPLGVNSGAGVCLVLPPTAAQTLDAEGDTYAGIDCTKVTTALSSGKSCTTGATDISIVTLGPTANTIDVAGCMP